MPRGGRRDGAGRPKGIKAPLLRQAPTKTTRQQTGEIVERALKGGDLTPLQAMLSNLKVIVGQADKMLQDGVPVDDSKHLQLRKLLQDVASAVAPYVHPRLSAIATIPAQVDAEAEAARVAKRRQTTDELFAEVTRMADFVSRGGSFGDEKIAEGEIIDLKPDGRH